jgi:hypothetical protein
MVVSLQKYRELIEERPRKFDAEEVNYTKDAEGKKQICFHCIHFFRRAIDDYGVCEIFRSEETDEEGVKPDAVCDLFTKNGESFPLYPGSR